MKKPWYKAWWVWVLVATVLITIINAVAANTSAQDPVRSASPARVAIERADSTARPSQNTAKEPASTHVPKTAETYALVITEKPVATDTPAISDKPLAPPASTPTHRGS